MTKQEFAAIFQEIARLYPGRMPTDSDTMSIWYAKLRHINPDVLRKAADMYGDTDQSDYPPNPFQLRKLAEKAAGSRDAVGDGAIDSLRGEQFRLYAEAHTGGEVDRPAWEKLITSFRNLGREHAAQHAREQLERVGGIDAV